MLSRELKENTILVSLIFLKQHTKNYNMEALIIWGYVVIAILSAFGAVNMIRQINKLK
jgi:hypothetical protein